jgi:hypothetical protein
MTEFDELRNHCEREAEAKFPGSGSTPGYRAARHGEWTPGAPGHDSAAGPLPPLRIPLVHDDPTFRTQMVLRDAEGERTFWVDAPLAMAETGKVSSVLPGDIVEIAEVRHALYVTQVCVGLREQDICVPYRAGTLMRHHQTVPRREGHGK